MGKTTRTEHKSKQHPRATHTPRRARDADWSDPESRRNRAAWGHGGDATQQDEDIELELDVEMEKGIRPGPVTREMDGWGDDEPGDEDEPDRDLR